MSKSAKIAALNDALRRTLSGGRIFKSDGIDALDADVQGKILEAVRTFADFTADNDRMANTTSAPSKSTADGVSGRSTTLTSSSNLDHLTRRTRTLRPGSSPSCWHRSISRCGGPPS